MKKAFSLIELLISLIVISLIIASFTPVLSKKLKHREVALGGGGKIETKCSERFNEKCMICSSTECVLCSNSFSCPLGKYCDEVDDCKCKNCSAKFSNCAKCTKNYCESCTVGYKPDAAGICREVTCNLGEYKQGSECKPCVSPCATCTGASSCKTCVSTHEMISGVCYVKCSEGWHREGTTCVQDVVYKNPKSQADCDSATNYSSIYVPYNISNPTEKGFCMQKKNAGDGIGPSIPTDISKYQARNTSHKCPSSASKCCWYGDNSSHKTGNKDQLSDGSNKCQTTPAQWNYATGKLAFDYDACSRTICNLNAAKQICATAGWELPSSTELNAIANIIKQEGSKTALASTQILKWMGASGLQLCQTFKASNDYGAPRCMSTVNSSGVCFGSDDTQCHPSRLWGSDATLNFDSGGPSVSSATAGNAYSVRCVLKSYRAN